MRKTIVNLLLYSIVFLSCEKSLMQNDVIESNNLHNYSFSTESNDVFSEEYTSTQDFQRVSVETNNLEQILDNNYDFLKSYDCERIKWLVLYSSNMFSRDGDLFENEITGISLFYVKNEQEFRHKAFKNNNQKFELTDKFDSFSSSILLPKTLKIISQSLSPNIKSYLIVINSKMDLKEFYLNDILDMQLSDYSLISKNNLFAETLNQEKYIPHLYSDCNPMNCPGPAEVGCKIDGGPGGGLDCRGDITDICFASSVNLEIEKRSLMLESLNLNEARDFRDNFLKSSNKGRSYIDYYYKINYVLQGMDFIKKISLISEYRLAKKIFSIIDDLNYSSNTAIMINETDKDLLIDSLTKLKTLSENKELVLIINAIISDIDLYTNKTKAAILDDFKPQITK